MRGFTESMVSIRPLNPQLMTSESVFSLLNFSGDKENFSPNLALVVHQKYSRSLGQVSDKKISSLLGVKSKAKCSAFKLPGVGKNGKKGGSWGQDGKIASYLLSICADGRSCALSGALPS